jgi:hypothetical protein
MKKKTTKQSKKPTASKTIKPTWAVMVLDETGSMAHCQGETISGYNAYVDGMRPSKHIKKFSLIKFDSTSITTVQDGVPLKDAIKLDNRNYQPGSMTNLYDAVGQTIHAMREKVKDHDVVFITLTDGLENASTHFTYEQVQHDIKESEKLGWTFAHIGVGNQGWAQGNQLYRGTRSVGNVLRTDGKNIRRSMAKAGGQAVAYAACSVIDKEQLKADFFAGKKDDTGE